MFRSLSALSLPVSPPPLVLFLSTSVCIYYVQVINFLCAFELSLQTELLYKKNPKLLNQFQYCEKELVPFIVIVGEDEKANGGVKIRDVQTRKEVSCFLYVAQDFAVVFFCTAMQPFMYPGALYVPMQAFFLWFQSYARKSVWPGQFCNVFITYPPPVFSCGTAQ